MSVTSSLTIIFFHGKYSKLSGPFGYLRNNRKSVDLTAPVGIISAGRLVVALLLDSDIWAISDPLADEVWYASIISVPLYLLAMGLADYVFFRKVNWRALSGFALRNVFS